MLIILFIFIGGNLGGLLFNLMFKYYANNFQGAFLVLGGITLGCGIIGCCILKVQGKRLYHVLSKQ